MCATALALALQRRCKFRFSALARRSEKVEQMEAEADVSKQLAAATLVQRGGRCCLAPR